MPSLRKYSALATLFLAGAAIARAHDALQSNTDLWLWPDRLEAHITMARVPSRALVDNAPDVPVTEDNFATVYHPLLQAAAAPMLAVSVDGHPLAPRSADVALSGDTDVQFTLIYPRPPDGRLRITAPFIQRMGDGYINTLALDAGTQVLGQMFQTVDQPAFEITLGPVAATPPARAPAAQATTATGDTYFIIPHFGLLSLMALALIILLAIWFFRQKSDV